MAGENSTTEPPMHDDEGKGAVTRCQDDRVTSGSWLISGPYISNLKEGCSGTSMQVPSSITLVDEIVCSGEQNVRVM